MHPTAFEGVSKGAEDCEGCEKGAKASRDEEGTGGRIEVISSEED